jgi:alpha-ketoglutaric semialdehyde dehydrogenase
VTAPGAALAGNFAEEKIMAFRNFIGGEWTDAQSGEAFAKVNPATGEEIGRFAASDAGDARAAIESARDSFARWNALPAPSRGEIMLRFAEILQDRKEELARIETEEMGKILAESRGDVQEGIDTAHLALGESRRLFGRTVPSELPNKLCMTTRRPHGVAALITPWNFPAALPCWKLIPALLCGNAVVFKPSRDAPHTGARLVECLLEAGVHPGAVNLLQGPGSKVGDTLCTHEAVGVVSFTGSVGVGRSIGEKAGGLLKKTSLELGGKNGLIVMDDANLDLALDSALWGAFGTSGQRCTATSRLIVHETIHDEFVARLVERTDAMKVGNGLDESVDMGPLVSERQREKVAEYVKIGRDEGATLACGGEACRGENCDKGFFHRPTVFTDVSPAMRIAREEIFGPVTAVLKVRNLDEAVEVMNDTEFGLASGIYTQDINTAMQAVARIDTGVVNVNNPTIGAECHLPFGGVKNTGNGHREGGWGAYDVFSVEHTVYIDFSGKLQKAQMDSHEGE